MSARDRAHYRRICAYAAKFAAQSVSAEPPVSIRPSDENLRVELAGCVRPPLDEELSQIRNEFLLTYHQRYAAMSKYCVTFNRHHVDGYPTTGLRAMPLDEAQETLADALNRGMTGGRIITAVLSKVSR